MKLLKNRRWKFFIKRDLQWRFIVGFSIIVIVAFLINWTIAYYIIDRELSESLYKIHIKATSTQEILGPVLWSLSMVTVLVVIVLAVATEYLLIRRIEPPLESFRDTVRRFGSGDLTQRLDSQELKDLFNTFNSTADALEREFASIKALAQRIEEASRRISEVSDNPSKEELLKTLQELSIHIEELEGRLSRFKV